MKYPKALSQNLIARYDAMSEIREANDRIKELESQCQDHDSTLIRTAKILR